MSDLRRVLSANIRAERARAGVRQADLAGRIGMPRATLSDIEGGRRKVTLGEAVEICEALGIALSQLLAGPDPDAVRARKVLCDGPDPGQDEARDRT